MKKILMISNMYPNKKYPHYGSFVRNTFNLINDSEEINVKKTVMHMHNNKVVKIFAYIMWYLRIIFFGIFGKYDCIYAHYISHSALPVRIVKAIRKNIILIENAHGEDVLAEEKCYAKNIKRSASVLKVTDLVVVPSRYYREVVKKTFGIPDNKIYVYPSGGVDRDIFHLMDKGECKEKFGRKEEFVVGFVARIESGKGWREFLEALAILKEMGKIFGVIIIGSGSEESILHEELKKKRLEEKCTFCKALPHQELAYAYNAMDVYCSSSRSESLGLVGLEAMASECECILSTAPGYLTYARDGYNAHIFERKNSKMLADKIVKVMEETKEIKAEIVKNGLKTAKEYDSKKVTNGLINKIKSELKLL